MDKRRSREGFRVKAADWNRMVAAANAHALQSSSQTTKQTPAARPITTAIVRNESGDTLPKHAAVAVGAAIIGPDDNLPEFQRVATFEVDEADSAAVAASPQRLAVLLEPLADGAFGSACLSGIVPCRVNFTDTSHRFAGLTDGETYLTSHATGGPAEVISPAPAEGGVTWVYVRLPGGGASSSPLTVQDDDPEGTTVFPVDTIEVDAGCFTLTDLGSGACHLTIASTVTNNITFTGTVSFSVRPLAKLEVSEVAATVPSDPGPDDYTATSIGFNQTSGFIVEEVDPEASPGEIRIHLTRLVGQVTATIPSDPGNDTYEHVLAIDFNDASAFIVEEVEDGEVRIHIAEMEGAGAESPGKRGLVPEPGAGDDDLFLRGDGAWAAPTASVGDSITLPTDAGSPGTPAADTVTIWVDANGELRMTFPTGLTCCFPCAPNTGLLDDPTKTLVYLTFDASDLTNAGTAGDPSEELDATVTASYVTALDGSTKAYRQTDAGGGGNPTLAYLEWTESGGDWDITDEYFFYCWVKYSHTDTRIDPFWYDALDTSGEFRLSLDPATNELTLFGGAGIQITHSVLVNPGTKYFIAAWRSSTDGKDYLRINATTEEDTGSGTVEPTAASAIRFCRFNSAGTASNCEWDSVLFKVGANVAPTTAQLDAIYNSGNGAPPGSCGQIPAAYIPASLPQLSIEVSQISDFPTLDDVATSGDHDDLSNIGTTSHADIDTHIAATAAHGATGAVVGTTNVQTLSNKVLASPDVSTVITPETNDSAALGTTSKGWSDLHLATGAVINWANGEVTITETDANTLTIAGATLITAGTACAVALGSVELGHASDTTLAREVQGGSAAIEGKTIARSIHFAGVLSGLGTAQAADADHDVTIAVGAAADSAGAAILYLSSAITKRIDAGWAVGTGNGGLDGSESSAGTPDANTWYHIWLIRRSDTGVVDALFSESATAPTMPTNYDQKCRIGAVLTDGSANIIDYIQDGDHFQFLTFIKDISAAAEDATANLRTVSVPPNQLGIFNALSSRAGTVYVLATDPDVTDQAVGPVSNAVPNVALAASTGGTLNGGGSIIVRVSSTSQIRTRAADSGNTMYFDTIGWIDSRGKF